MQKLGKLAICIAFSLAAAAAFAKNNKNPLVVFGGFDFVDGKRILFVKEFENQDNRQVGFFVDKFVDGNGNPLNEDAKKFFDLLKSIDKPVSLGSLRHNEDYSDLIVNMEATEPLDMRVFRLYWSGSDGRPVFEAWEVYKKHRVHREYVSDGEYFRPVFIVGKNDNQVKIYCCYEDIIEKAVCNGKEADFKSYEFLAGFDYNFGGIGMCNNYITIPQKKFDFDGFKRKNGADKSDKLVFAIANINSKELSLKFDCVPKAVSVEEFNSLIKGSIPFDNSNQAGKYFSLEFEEGRLDELLKATGFKRDEITFAYCPLDDYGGTLIVYNENFLSLSSHWTYFQNKQHFERWHNILTSARRPAMKTDGKK